MKILVVGSGGREHALTWKLAQSPKASKLFCAPGNGGINSIAECIPIRAEDNAGLLKFAREQKIDLTVVGPEVPLVGGITDEFERVGLKIFGPSKAAAQLEGSKEFAKRLMEKSHVPTAAFGVFTDESKAAAYLEKQKAPIVVKADGLAAGKGVTVAPTIAGAKAAVHQAMGQKIFGAAGRKVVIEEFLEGEEASILAFTDGKTVRLMVPSQDHKRIFDNDQGPNTGGMGAYSPAPVVTAEILQKAENEVIKPIIAGMAKAGIVYKGIIYAGLMIKDGQIKVLEFNIRFGDPETQVVIPRLKTDLVEIIEAILAGKLDQLEIKWDNKAATCVVLAAGGYPGDYKKGEVVSGLGAARELDDVIIFHAGTRLQDGKLVTSGGRVLGVVGIGDTIKSSIERAYTAVEKISFPGMQYRKDIGYRALQRS